MKKIILLTSFFASLAFPGVNVGGSLMMATLDTGYGDVNLNIPTLNGGFAGREGNFGWEAKLGFGLATADDTDDDGDEWSLEIENFLQLKGKYFFQENFYGALVYTNASVEACAVWANECISDDESDTGFHVGYLVNESFEIFGGQVFSDDDVFEIGFSYSF